MSVYPQSLNDLMSMPECMLLTLHSNIPRIRAIRVLDQIDAISFPHMEKSDRDKAFDRLIGTASASIIVTDDPYSPPVVTFNGINVGARGIKKQLESYFGLGAV